MGAHGQKLRRIVGGETVLLLGGVGENAAAAAVHQHPDRLQLPAGRIRHVVGEAPGDLADAVDGGLGKLGHRPAEGPLPGVAAAANGPDDVEGFRGVVAGQVVPAVGIEVDAARRVGAVEVVGLVEQAKSRGLAMDPPGRGDLILQVSLDLGSDVRLVDPATVRARGGQIEGDAVAAGPAAAAEKLATVGALGAGGTGAITAGGVHRPGEGQVDEAQGLRLRRLAGPSPQVEDLLLRHARPGHAGGKPVEAEREKRLAGVRGEGQPARRATVRPGRAAAGTQPGEAR